MMLGSKGDLSKSMRLPALVLALATALFASTGTPHASAVHAALPEIRAVPGYVLPETETWELRGADGYPYQIFVSKPAGPPPNKGWPVLYVLDGNAMFAGFAEARRIQSMDDASEIAKTIIVGVGFKTEKPYALRRLYDFTGGPPPPPWDVEFASQPNGGWDKFLDFLTGSLRGAVDRRYKIDDDRQALFGHSLGGLLAIHALFTRPAAFHAIIAASPSLFWHDREMQAEERDFAARLRNGQIPKVSRLMVVCGKQEDTALERLDAESLGKRMELLSGFGLRTRADVYADEGHLTVPSRAVTSTLRFAFSWP